MSNHSAEYPNGILDKETLKSFFAVTEAADGTLSWTPGYERIPDNWYYPTLQAKNKVAYQIQGIAAPLAPRMDTAQSHSPKTLYKWRLWSPKPSL